MTTDLHLNPALRRYRPVLVDLNCASVWLELHVDVIGAMVDTGQLRWVFNLAAPGARRELRFHLGELIRLKSNLRPIEGDVIEAIVGHATQPALHTETVCAILQTRRQSVHHWLRAGELTGPNQMNHRQMIHRISLVRFLHRRRV